MDLHSKKFLKLLIFSAVSITFVFFWTLKNKYFRSCLCQSNAANHNILVPSNDLLNFDYPNFYTHSLSENGSVVKFRVWKALCDATGSINYDMRAVIIYILIDQKNTNNNLSRMLQNLYCHSDPSVRSNFSFKGRRHSTFYKMLFVFCVFDANYSCPKKIFLAANKNQNFSIPLFVEIQDAFVESKGDLAICLPVISNFSLPQFSAERVVEFMEYNKLIGVAHVYQPMLNPREYPLVPTPSLVKIWRYYQKRSFLTIDNVISHPLTDIENLFWQVRDSREFHSSNCVIKHATRYRYIVYQDHDEVIAFDMNRFKKIGDVLDFAKSQWNEFGAINYKDCPMDINCKSKNADTSYLISTLSSKFDQSLNDGKTVLHSKYCFAPNPHSCNIQKDKIFETFRRKNFKQGLVSVATNYQKVVQDNSEDELFHDIKQSTEPLLLNYHYRSRKTPPMGRISGFESRDWCKKYNSSDDAWLVNIRSKLHIKSKTVVAELF